MKQEVYAEQTESALNLFGDAGKAVKLKKYFFLSQSFDQVELIGAAGIL